MYDVCACEIVVFFFSWFISVSIQRHTVYYRQIINKIYAMELVSFPPIHLMHHTLYIFSSTQMFFVVVVVCFLKALISTR